MPIYPRFFWIATLFWSFLLCPWSLGCQTKSGLGSLAPERRIAGKAEVRDIEEIQRVVVEAFQQVHAGFSSDEILLQDELQAAFQAECQRLKPDGDAEAFNWELLNARKQGKLAHVETTRRLSVDLDNVRHTAEIVARSIQDAHQVSIDRAFCRPTLRQEFDRQAKLIDPDVDGYRIRKAALQLRKARLLRPELITRIADWGRQVTIHDASQLQQDLSLIPESAGIYIFSDRKGYLYIGESDNLRKRLTSHLDESDRKSLGSYLKQQELENITIEIHTFEAGSRIEDLTVRRAYESELIRSRNPRFNIRP